MAAAEYINPFNQTPDYLEYTEELKEVMSKYRVADAHCHIYPEKIAEKATEAIGAFYEAPMASKNGGPETLLKLGRAQGIDKYLVCSVATTLKQVNSITNFIYDECNKHPEFIGMGAFYQEVEDVDQHLDWIMELGLKGVKIHPDFQKVNIDDPRLMPLYEGLEKRGLAILLHMGDMRYEFSEPIRLARVLEKYPDLRAIAAHFGGHAAWDKAKIALADAPCMFDSSSSLSMISKEMAYDLVETYGPQKIMFGTDFPMWNVAAEYQRFLNIGLSEEDNADIFYNNFAKFFDID